MSRICDIDGCEKRHEARGWCHVHYARWLRNGHPTLVLRKRTKYPYPDNVLRRLMFHPPTTRDTGCITWEGGLTNAGYGQISVDGKMQLVHRHTYEWVNGPIPDGLEIDHLCRNRACCNSGHLEAVTHRENGLRGLRGRLYRKKAAA